MRALGNNPDQRIAIARMKTSVRSTGCLSGNPGNGRLRRWNDEVIRVIR